MESAFTPQADQTNRVPLLGIVMSVCDAMDLVSPAIVNHHKRTAYIAYSIASHMGLSPEEQGNVFWAGLLHDSGAFSLKNRLQLLEFEVESPDNHAEVGYKLLRDFDHFSKAAQLIRFHHTRWEQGLGRESSSGQVPLGSHILHLADRVAVLTGSQETALGRAAGIMDRITQQSGEMFVPELVDVLRSLADKHFFWLDATSPSMQRVLERVACDTVCQLDRNGLRDLAQLLCRLIDFRSRFTSTHSSGVAVCSGLLGKYFGLSEDTRELLEIAGFLHDLGKLVVPLEILEKPAQFTAEEFDIMRPHPYHTFHVLTNINGLEDIVRWAAYHHERLDGSGYPFCVKGQDLDLEARIIAVADVFTALAEDRPYRKGMSEMEIVRLLKQMVEKGLFDDAIVSSLVGNLDELNVVRRLAQRLAAEEYRQLWSASDR